MAPPKGGGCNSSMADSTEFSDNASLGHDETEVGISVADSSDVADHVNVEKREMKKRWH